MHQLNLWKMKSTHLMENDVILQDNSLYFNRAQRNFLLNLPTTKFGKSIWGRGTGKSSVIAWLMHIINLRMPRSCWIIQGASFQQILTRTLPGTLASLEKLGYKRDVDYFINRFPPYKYYLPYQAPAKAEHCIFLVNHTNKCVVAFTLFSQDRASSRGPNRDGCIVDESLLLDVDKFNSETKPTIRGNREYFGKIKMHEGVFHFSSMPHSESFLFDDIDYYEKNGSNVLQLRDKITSLQYEFVLQNDKHLMLELWSEIYELEKQVNFYSHKGMYYSEYNAFDNIKQLGLSYIKNQLNSTSELLFLIEILNKRIRKITGSFYAHLDRNHHGYKGHFDYNYLDNMELDFTKLTNATCLQDKDCLSDLPLCIGLDYGTAINWLVVGQHLQSINQFNFLRNFIVKSPKIIDDVIKDFCKYYKDHKKRLIYLYGDAEGNNPRANVPGQTSYVEQVMALLRAEGWVVINKNTNRTNPEHHFKYLLWSRCLNPKTEFKSIYPVIRFNLIGCKELLLSMEQSPVKDDNSRIGKDKGSEKKRNKDRELATDGGDAADQIIYGLFSKLLKVNYGVTVDLM